MLNLGTTSRRNAILKAARICFLDRGFVKTTISDIVALSGGSRSTIYEEFGSKEGLFAALISSLVDQMALPDLPGGPPEAVLPELATSYLKQLLDPEALALYRVVIGESAHVRNLGAAIFAAGPNAATSLLAARLKHWTDQGVLDIVDHDLAARLFLAMVEGDLHRSALMWSGEPDSDAIAANVEASVALFLSGARSKS
jgi:TetR/AcrR family transcriptional regulator, mexJK operon transcriptional repressor